jgi:ferredoxin
MPFIITDPCIGTKDSACVDVCPVDCIHPRKDEPEFETASMLYIHPDECIDYEACVPECPVEAIFHEDNLPEQWKGYAALNAEMAKQSPNIVEKQDPLEGDQCVGKKT